MFLFFLNVRYFLSVGNENFITNAAKLSSEHRKLSTHCRVFS